jgi:hypothetical protein
VDWSRLVQIFEEGIWTNLDQSGLGCARRVSDLDQSGPTKDQTPSGETTGPRDHGPRDHGPQDHGPRTTGPRTARGGANWVPGQGKKFNVRIGSGWFGSAGVSSAVGFFFRTIKKAESVFREFQFGPRGVKVKLREIK